MGLTGLKPNNFQVVVVVCFFSFTSSRCCIHPMVWDPLPVIASL